MTKKQENKILSLRKKGLSIKNIAKTVGIGEHAVSKFLKEHAASAPTAANAKTKGKGKKSVDGSDEVRIRFAKDNPDVTVKPEKADDPYACSVSVSVNVPAFLDEEDVDAINHLCKRIAKALKLTILEILEDYDCEECDEDGCPCDECDECDAD